MLIFVYGTLKTGEHNHSVLKEQTHGLCVWKGKGITVEKYPLVVATRYNVPFLLYKPGTGHNIEGELYEVDAKCLDDLDQMEYCPRFYERVPLDVRVRKETQSEERGDQIMTCQTYVIVQFRDYLLDLPMFKCYTNNINGMKFIMPTERRSDSLPLYEIHKGFERPSSEG